MDLKQVINSIPDYDAFLTIDEMHASTRQLAREFPDLVTVRTIGESRQGDPIQLISIGESERNALVYAGAHANEAIGCMTAEFLSCHLCENQELRQELGYAWHFLKCLDADGMRLNEGWFKGPFKPTHYHSNFYRQPQNEQPENLFPIEYKTLKFDQPFPETLALQAAIDAVEPEFMWSLHNAEFGGVFYYLSGPCEPLYSVFTEIAESFDLPFNLGETSLAFETYAPAIHKTLAVTDLYEALLARGIDDPAREISRGGSANEYAEENYGTFTLVVEVPYWADERFNDLSPVEISRRDDVQQTLSKREAFAAWMQSHVDSVQDELRLNTPFHRVIAEALAYAKKSFSSQRIWLGKATDVDRPATMAEHFSAVYFQEHGRQRVRGMFVRMMDAEIAAGNDTDAIVAAREAVFAQLQEVGARLENELDYNMIPTRTAVNVQVWAGLVTAEALSS